MFGIINLLQKCLLCIVLWMHIVQIWQISSYLYSWQFLVCHFISVLAQRGYFKDKAFVNYLKYLLYWKEPEYAKYLKYPQCLHMLELLQYEHFRKELVNAQCAKFIDEQQILHWQHYSRKRMRLQQALAEQQQQNNTSVKWKMLGRVMIRCTSSIYKRGM